MTSLMDKYARVTAKTPCPICGKPDWCLIARDGADAVCARIESCRPWGEAGWLHTVDPSRRVLPAVFCRTNVRPVFDAESAWSQYQEASGTLDADAKAMDVSVDSLDRIGCATFARGVVFPMRNATGSVIGIRVRETSGHKYAVTGSRNGLFFDPESMFDDWMVVVEGPTDTAAVLDLGFQAVGRPSCNTGDRIVVELARRCKSKVCIVSDADRKDGCDCQTGWCRKCRPGQHGAVSLATELCAAGLFVKIVEPPRHKDMRSWLNAGCDRKSLSWLINNAPAWRPHGQAV